MLIGYFYYFYFFFLLSIFYYLFLSASLLWTIGLIQINDWWMIDWYQQSWSHGLPTQNSPLAVAVTSHTIGSTEVRRLRWPEWLVMWGDGLPAPKLSPIPPLTRFNIERLRWWRPTRCRYAKPPPAFWRTEEGKNVRTAFTDADECTSQCQYRPKSIAAYAKWEICDPVIFWYNVIRTTWYTWYR